MSLRLLHVPGLVRRHVEGGWLQSLRDTPPDHRAQLVCSFPALPAVLEATLRSGCGPAAHGVHDASASLDSGFDRLASSTVEFVRHAELFEALREGGPGSPEESDALLRLDRWLDGRLAAPDGEGPTLLAGGPSVSTADTCLELEAFLDGSGARAWRVESSLAWIGSGDAAALREELLHLRGVERVLRGRALEILGCDPAQGLLVVAQPGVSFEAKRGVYGRVDPESGEEPVLLGWNWPGRWPAAVHDVRVAPTLVRRAGGAAREGDDPLPIE